MPPSGEGRTRAGADDEPGIDVEGTGTALAAIAVLAGVPAAEAVAWVRRHHNRRAVETPWPRRWVGDRAR